MTPAIILAAALSLEALSASAQAQPVRLNVSFYCGCQRCCGAHSPEAGGHGLTTSGARPVRGLTIAAPRGIPFGTALCIEGVGLRVVQDRGGSISGDRIDVYVRSPLDAPGHYEHSHRLALELARQHLRAWVLGPYADEVIACEAQPW